MSNHSIDWRHGLRLAAGLASLGALAFIGLAPAGGTNYGIPLTATFGDASGDQIGSDGKGPYINGVNNVEVVFDGRGDFHLDTSVGGQAPIRFLSLDFSQPATTITCGPPFAGPHLEDGYMTTGVGGLPTMPLNVPTASTLAVHFPGWFVKFDPSVGGSDVTVTRTASNTWTIVSGSGTYAELQQVTQVKGKLVLTNCGSFYMPFSVTAVTQ